MDSRMTYAPAKRNKMDKRTTRYLPVLMSAAFPFRRESSYHVLAGRLCKCLLKITYIARKVMRECIINNNCQLNMFNNLFTGGGRSFRSCGPRGFWLSGWATAHARPSGAEGPLRTSAAKLAMVNFSGGGV